MNWADERYVRVYTRDTADFMMLSIEAQWLWWSLLRKVDRAGILDLGRGGTKSVALVVGRVDRWKTIGPALTELTEDGCVSVTGSHPNQTLVIRNFRSAQEVAQSDRQRQAESRQRRLDLAKRGMLGADEKQESVTNRDENVTPSHAATEPVTPSHSVLNQTVPSRTEPTKPISPPKEPGGIQPPLFVAQTDTPTPTEKKKVPKRERAPKAEEPSDPTWHADLALAWDAFKAGFGVIDDTQIPKATRALKSARERHPIGRIVEMIQWQAAQDWIREKQRPDFRWVLAEGLDKASRDVPDATSNVLVMRPTPASQQPAGDYADFKKAELERMAARFPVEA